MIYLISSNSYHLIEDEIDKIVKNKHYDTIDYLTTTINEIIEETSYTDLFNNEKILVIKNCNIFESKVSSDTKLLEQYLNNPNPLTTLIFICSGVDERKKIYKIINENYKAIIIKPLYKNDIVNKLVLVSQNKGYILDNSDALYISESSLNNYDIAYNNLEKLFLYYDKPTKILRKDIYNIVSISLEDNNFRFVDEVINHNIDKALSILEDFKIEKIDPLSLFNLLAREYRLMLLSQVIYKDTKNINNIMEKLHLAKWQADKALKNSFNYSLTQLEDELLCICDYDYKIKSGQIDKYLALEMYLLKE